jgi:curved DNA-binding protein CbpA
MPQLPDHYRTLRVQPTASAAQIRRAYHLLAKQYHPDRTPPNRRGWAREQMARINAAYDTLGDPHKRAEYDRLCGYTGTANGETMPTQGRPVWRGQRIRERSRRRHIERWRTISMVSLAALAVGLLATALFIRAPLGYVFAAAFNGSILGLLILSLVMVNR